MNHVLVTYASKMGSTREIAEHVGARLTESGCAADVRSVDLVDSVDGYRAVVLGSAVYANRWRREALRFLHRFRHRLAARPVWLFESGWVGSRPSVLVATPAARRWASRLGAPAPAVFGGRLDPDLATGPLDRTLAKALPGDARDWDAIRSWSDRVGHALTAGRTHQGKES